MEAKVCSVDGSTMTLTERLWLSRCYSGAVHDVLRMMGHEHVVLPPRIKAIAPGTRLAGRMDGCWPRPA